jgi:hypothetical protein
MLSSVHNFIWVKGGKHSYILSVMPLHGHKEITGRWLYITFQKLLRQVALPFCFHILYPQELFFSWWRNREKRSTVRCSYNSQYIIEFSHE